MRPSLRFLACVATASLLFTGCGGKDKDESSTPPPRVKQPKTPDAATAAPAAPDAAAPPPAPGAVAATAQPATGMESEAPSQDVVKTVLSAVQSYVIAKSKNPKDLDELVRTGFLKQIPPAPPGKKLVFDAAKLEVKLVNQ